jgi:hypothetical protein
LIIECLIDKIGKEDIQMESEKDQMKDILGLFFDK